jgi:hypothetical protein
MLYRKNIRSWEQVTHLLAGVAMLACGLIALAGNPVGYLVAGVGVATFLTGLFGYCPACAVAGRKLE